MQSKRRTVHLTSLYETFLLNFIAGNLEGLYNEPRVLAIGYISSQISFRPQKFSHLLKTV